MAVNIELDDFEAICALGAIEMNIDKYRDFCRETDDRYGRYNDITREQIAKLEETQRKLHVALVARGYAFTYTRTREKITGGVHEQ